MPRKETKTSETKTSETKTSESIVAIYQTVTNSFCNTPRSTSKQYERTKFRLTPDEQPADFNAKDKSLGNHSSTGITVQFKQPKKATEN